MSTSHHHTASGRPLRIAPAWVGAAKPPAGSPAHPHLPVREAVWIWSVRRYARLALWALPAAAVLQGWTSVGVQPWPGPLIVELGAAWLSLVAMIALAGLLAGSRTRRPALAGLLLGLAGFLIALPVAALPAGVAAAGTPLSAAAMPVMTSVGAGSSGAGWLLLGWAVFRSKLVNPADGVLLMLAAAAIAGTPFANEPLPTVGALLLLAAGTGLAWTGGRLTPAV